LAKATLAGKVNGELVDASFVIEANSTLSIITDKDEAGLEVIPNKIPYKSKNLSVPLHFLRYYTMLNNSQTRTKKE
jgi:hypothetical protein